MQKAALISVSDKTGIVDFAKQLVNLGYAILASSGSAKELNAAGISTVNIDQYTAQPEILGGRVKTLHPKIHGGILARRDVAGDIAELERSAIMAIDIVIVNLYPFVQNLRSAAASDPLKMIELIDVGGPAMIRAAAKNHRFVLPLIDPADYSEATKYLTSGLEIPLEFRRSCAAKVFSAVAAYDLEIGRYLSQIAASNSYAPEQLPPVTGMVLREAQGLRYGENPHQAAGYYLGLEHVGCEKWWTQLGGKELSYNNILDFDAAWRIIQSLTSEPSAVIIKHLNPCGVASAATLLEAFKLAKQGDPRSHFGGIMAFSREVDTQVAAELKEGFAEIVVAPSYSKEALTLLQRNKNLRIITVDLDTAAPRFELRTALHGILVQQRDLAITAVTKGEVVSTRKPTDEELRSLDFAWKICAHVKSNAIVLAHGTKIVSIGAGQMSRIDSAELAISKADTNGNELGGAVCASDAFFPFPDSVEALIRRGITAFVAPAGAKRDQETIDTVNRGGAALIFMNERHFRH